MTLPVGYPLVGSTGEDVLDSMTDGRWWLVGELAEDTGRRVVHIRSAFRFLSRHDFVEGRVREGHPCRAKEWRITAEGRRALGMKTARNEIRRARARLAQLRKEAANAPTE